MIILMLSLEMRLRKGQLLDKQKRKLPFSQSLRNHKKKFIENEKLKPNKQSIFDLQTCMALF